MILTVIVIAVLPCPLKKPANALFTIVIPPNKVKMEKYCFSKILTSGACEESPIRNKPNGTKAAIIRPKNAPTKTPCHKATLSLA